MKVTTSRKIFKIAAITGGCIAPAVYITKKHMDFYPPSQPKQRESMRNRMIGFFVGLTPGLYMIHKAAKSNLKHSKNMAIGIGGAIITAIGAKLGIEVGKKISN